MLCKCGCDEEIVTIEGKEPKQFYSDACRKRYNRSTSDKIDCPTSDNPTPDTIEQATPDKLSGHGSYCPYNIIDGQEVYHRQAVSYIDDSFASRPMPLHVLDKPVPDNRGMYIDSTGCKYLFDCMGSAFKKGVDWQSSTRMPVNCG